MINAAIVGLRNRLQLSSDLTVNVLFERRVGLGAASIADPVRALPFLQTEGDYWSAAAGLELLPKAAPYRLSARAEYKDGTVAPFLIIHDGPGQMNLIRNALDNLTISKDNNRKLPAFIAIAANRRRSGPSGASVDSMSTSA